MQRTIIIGDIHGCYEEWEQLLKKVRFDSRQDRLILLGDLIDRGKDSYRVFQRAVELREEMQERFVVLKGSHEKMLLDDSKKIKDRILWCLVGKGATVRSFRSNGGALKDCADWFRAWSVPYYEAEDFQCAHAGVKEENPADNEEYTLFMDHRWVKRNRYHGKLTITGHIHLKEPAWYDGTGGKGQMLSYQQRMSLPQEGTICIDTGCAEENKLTAMVIQEKQFYLECVKYRNRR